MKLPQSIAIVAAFVSMAGVTTWSLVRDHAPAPNSTTSGERSPLAVVAGAIQAIPADSGADPKKAALGKRLFADSRLSADGTISCASCHDLAKGGADGRATAVGIGGALGPINTPTVLNASLNFKQFWDG